jgi:hypothetical protein
MANDGQYVFAGDASAFAGSRDAAQIDADFAGESADCGSGGDDLVAVLG